jgi:DNA repair exonuclease SbcCD ATPase subunit
MPWKSIEDVRRLQQEYERAVERYEQVEKAFREAKGRGDTDQADKLFAQLQEQFPELTSLFNQLNEARSELAQARDEAKGALA